ncbi:MAG: hypothetical protein HOP31_09015 [Ignavibacteria bacterium]|nr:hypothetical protein [Ignavibacteria bacterium]
MKKSFSDWEASLKPSKKPVKNIYKVCRVVTVLNSSGSVQRFLKNNSNQRLIIIKTS